MGSSSNCNGEEEEEEESGSVSVSVSDSDSETEASSSSLNSPDSAQSADPPPQLPLPPTSLSLSLSAVSAARSTGFPFKRCPSKRSSVDSPPASRSSRSRENISLFLPKAKLSVAPSISSSSISTNTRVEKQDRTAPYVCSVLASIALFCFLLQGSAVFLIRNSEVSALKSVPDTPLVETDIGHDRPLEYNVKFVPFQPALTSPAQQRRRRMRETKNARTHLGLHHPRLALVSPNLQYTPEAVYLITIAETLQALGYKLELYAFHDGPMQDTWKSLGVPVAILCEDGMNRLNVDWLNYQGVIAISRGSKVAVSSLMQEPFKSVAVVWIIFDGVLGQRLRNYQASGDDHLFSEWKQAFKRVDAVIFLNHALAMVYSLIDSGNFMVIPGSPVEIWDADRFMATHSREGIRKHFGLQDDDIAIAIVGSPFTYKWTWKEHALIMKSFLLANEDRNILKEDNGSLKMLFLGGNSTCGYKSSLKAMSHHLGLIDGTVSYHCSETLMNSVLWASDAVIYSSFREEQAFPDILTRAMAFGKSIIAPNNTLFQTYITDGVNGFLYEFGNVVKLGVVLAEVVSKHVHNISSAARAKSNDTFVDEVVREYVNLLDKVIQFPSETLLPKSLIELPEAIPKTWSWHHFKDFSKKQSANAMISNGFTKKVNIKERESHMNTTFSSIKEPQAEERDKIDLLSYGEWVEEKALEKIGDIKQHEEDELLERHDISRGSWEEVYRSVKKVERSRYELHERDDGELERTGQLLCIYEPYLGSGAWPFLHRSNSLYRGISLLSKQRRPGSDDIDAALRLPLLNNSYYRDVFCEFGTFLALANRIDRIHKNAWIGFQSWRAKGRKVALSTDAEKTVLDALRLRTHGNVIYFWAKLEDVRLETKGVTGTVKDFWSYCDAVNGNSCRSFFINGFKLMHGIPSTWTSLPPMPSNTGTWAVLNSWIMPTSSFLEFVMFSRMFIDAVDSQHYYEHIENGTCCLGVTNGEAKHCYCRLLELLVNVWAYHSAHRIIYVDPITGSMQEQHGLQTRKNQMWINFFELSVLKGMDEDMAEEADDDSRHTGRRWLWPHTGEIYSRRIHERERHARYGQKMERKKQNRERLERMRSRHRQRPLASG